jgi:hypothetical protein
MKNIQFVNWLTTEQVTKLMLCADLGVFPGTHSTLWEQATGLGLPCIFKRWAGIEHLDVGGNCIYMDDFANHSIRNTILDLYNNDKLYTSMKTAASTLGVEMFSYSNIARLAIEDNE